MRELQGDDSVVLFRNTDEFAGVDPAWLLPRLRLDPDSSPVNATDGLTVFLDGRDLVDSGLSYEQSIYGAGPWEEELASFESGGLIWGLFEQRGEWVLFVYPEVTFTLFYVGIETDPHEVIHRLLPHISHYWEPMEDDEVSFASPVLNATRSDDRDLCLSVSGLACTVTLNGVEIRSEALQG